MSKAITIPYRYLNFNDKVKILYKKSLRNLEDWIHDRADFRVEAVKTRAKFDEIINCKDSVRANLLLDEADKELFQNSHYQPKKFPDSVGGCAYNRYVPTPDWVLDYWHPLEKAQYPEYFARREQRKKEYIEWWEKTYGKPSLDDHH
ncbi:NADH dehydrogenase [ubiquinone] 1 beta subcomplex subunit 9-like [Macrosteles quadrilineatus]|uniref:NADH dehydrogenase [ubiquinone] 1 beta subcomplex subunit 9-like n=1 Tax=Macrosteles quadrilineatus TaxID=74068 RepID=UPI0023E2B55E|nr:NADH dehydrogenase [ubiquinone] 1 beta subcomplex subunit 9-like [Macrosteles quadrilineatus]